MPFKTLPSLFEESVRRYTKNILICEKTGNKYEGISYIRMKELVYNFAAGLIQLGLQSGDRAALISEGRKYWVMSELGILYSGAINVPISVKIDELSELKFRLAHSGCKIAIVSETQLNKIRKIKNDLPDLEKVVLLDSIKDPDEDEMTVDSVLKFGELYLKDHRNEIDERWRSIKETDCANICYTSGTTADPKGIVLSHLNYVANIEQASKLLNIPEHYISLLILPWDHAFAHTAGIYTLMYNGASMASVQTGKSPIESLKNIPQNIKEVRPSFLLSVPSLAKNFRKNIEKNIHEKGTKIEKIFQKALKLAYDYNKEGWNKGKGIQKLKKPLYIFYDKLIFSKIRENFGGRLEFFIGGGALLDIELQRFFYAIGIPMFQGYGLTEAAPVISANVPQKHKLGSSGSIVPNLQVKICDQKGNEVPIGEKGEIVVKGENVMTGYWKNIQATNEVIKAGWLFTGDLGYLDEDGFLFVLGRNKSLLISSDGEKYSPEGIEETITEQSKFIDQIMLYNNQCTYTIALIVPDKEAILKWLKEKNLKCSQLEGQERVLKLIDSEINEFLDGGKFEGMFPKRWIPSAIAVLGEGFTEQNHFLNSTLKMVRGKIIEFYKNRIDFAFTPDGKNICNHQNRIIISRLDSTHKQS
jgi:long-chain acyl-CoA synthetase